MPRRATTTAAATPTPPYPPTLWFIGRKMNSWAETIWRWGQYLNTMRTRAPRFRPKVSRNSSYTILKREN